MVAVKPIVVVWRFFIGDGGGLAMVSESIREEISVARRGVGQAARPDFSTGSAFVAAPREIVSAQNLPTAKDLDKKLSTDFSLPEKPAPAVRETGASDRASGVSDRAGGVSDRAGSAWAGINLSRIDALKHKLGDKILSALADPETLEITLNPDGLLWQHRLALPKRTIGAMGFYQSTTLLNQLAGCFNEVVNAEHPILECELPIDGSRFAGQVPPIVGSPTFAIRKRALKIFTLDDYVAQEILSPPRCEIIRAAIKERKNILVLGGTGSGKTTFANAVLHEITRLDPDCRQIIIEDVCELQSRCRDRVNFSASIHCSATQLLKAALRMCPDRIIVGEVRDGAAHDLLQCWNTGHPGGVSTIHANDCLAALNRLVNLVSQNPNAPRVIEPDVAIAVNVLVCIRKNPAHKSQREVSEIRWVDGYDRERGFLTRDADARGD